MDSYLTTTLIILAVVFICLVACMVLDKPEDNDDSK